jgi:hypothetical protein
MPIAERAASVFNVTLEPRQPVPLIRGWNRLEGRPRSVDFERSLRAEVRDPLWFLTRQWQYGEFEGEDAGSPIDARIAYRTAPLDGYRTGDQELPYDSTTPLEVRVEREPVQFDLMLHMQVARVFERLLRERGREARLSDYAGLLSLDFDATVAGEPTVEARALFETGRRFLFDAARLIAAVRDGSHATRVAGWGGMTPQESIDLTEAGVALVAWYERTYAQPDGADTAWRPGRLDYRFSCSAKGALVSVTASGHRGGDLDWHAFDSRSMAPAPDDASAPAVALSFLPTSIRFAGMPSPRYWEMEDGKTDFGRLDINANDLARLLLAEFMLLFSNDWCIVPLELAVGSLTRIQGVLVTDVFGEQTLIRTANRGRAADWQRWSMYRLDGDDDEGVDMLLAPALTKSITSPAIEEVRFLRDEMANMVWAVEHRVMSKLGEPLDLELAAPAAGEAEQAATVARYRLGYSVPPNWRPFVPAHLPESTRAIRLQRARLPDQPALPRGRILDAGTPYFIAEEEVPRAGRLVVRAFQRARWTSGRTFLWIGRTSSVGRGEGASGLAFDQIEEPPADSPAR